MVGLCGNPYFNPQWMLTKTKKGQDFKEFHFFKKVFCLDVDLTTRHLLTDNSLIWENKAEWLSWVIIGRMYLELKLELQLKKQIQSIYFLWHDIRDWIQSSSGSLLLIDLHSQPFLKNVFILRQNCHAWL